MGEGEGTYVFGVVPLGEAGETEEAKTEEARGWEKPRRRTIFLTETTYGRLSDHADACGYKTYSSSVEELASTVLGCSDATARVVMDACERQLADVCAALAAPGAVESAGVRAQLAGHRDELCAMIALLRADHRSAEGDRAAGETREIPMRGKRVLSVPVGWEVLNEDEAGDCDRAYLIDPSRAPDGGAPGRFVFLSRAEPAAITAAELLGFVRQADERARALQGDGGLGLGLDDVAGRTARPRHPLPAVEVADGRPFVTVTEIPARSDFSAANPYGAFVGRREGTRYDRADMHRGRADGDDG